MRVDWNKVRYYRPEDFRHPEKVDDSVVVALDTMAGLGLRVTPIDDWRAVSENPKSQHLIGRAVDFVVPVGITPEKVLGFIKRTRVFTGYGVYTNEKGAYSYHVDTRTDRKVDNPATWGAWKDRTAGIVSWQYTGLADLLSKVTSSKIGPVIALALAALVLYWLLKK